MKIHRFYIGQLGPHNIQKFPEEKAWVQDAELRHQWMNVLRFQIGEEVSIFDDNKEVLYKITEIKPDEITLHKITEVEPKRAEKQLLLAWSLLKKDNNDWVIQKATELGVTKLVPLTAERSEKTGFDNERAHKIAIEAAEQCGRIDIPEIDEPMTIAECLERYKDHYILHVADQRFDKAQRADNAAVGVLVGPEGGWSELEFRVFDEKQLARIHLGKFTLRAETAAVVAIAKLVQ